MISRNGDGKLHVDWKIVTMIISLAVAGVSGFNSFIKDKTVLERSALQHDNEITSIKLDQKEINRTLSKMEIRLAVIEAEVKALSAHKEERQ